VDYTNALNAIRDYAESNTGTAPVLLTYLQAGVTGLTKADGAENTVLLAAVNDAMRSTPITGQQADTTGDIQAVVNAYTRILAEANLRAVDATPGDNPAASDYLAIGVTLGASATDAHRLALLNDMVGERAVADVDSVAEIEALVVVINRLFDAPQDITLADLSALDITNASADQLTAIRQALANPDAAYQPMDSLADVASAATSGTQAHSNALSLIAAYADNSTQPAPTVANFVTAGVTGVSSTNLSAVRSALASVPVAAAQADSTAEVQAIVDAYQVVLAYADSS
jgi:hypothetical protein